MNRIIKTTIALLKDNLRTKFVVLEIIIFPLVLLLIFSLIFGSITSLYRVNVYIVGDQTLASYLNTTSLFVGHIGGSLEEAIKGGGILVIVNKSNISIFYSKQFSEFVVPLKSIIAEYFYKFNYSNFNLYIISNYTLYSYIVTGIIGVIILSNGIFSISAVASNYYRSKIIERLASSPLENYEWSVSLILYNIIITFISILFIILFSTLFNFISNISILLIPIYLIFSFLSSGIGALVYGFTPKDKIYISQSLGTLIVLLLMFLSNTFLPTDVFPEGIRIFVEYQPLSIINDIIRDLTIYQIVPPIFEVLLIIIITAVIVIFSLFVLKLRET
jgi:ABC-2 type transport system permease protein